jgi:CBS domain-containing protein
LTIARKEIVSINFNRPVEYALHILIDNNIRRLVITDDAGKFIGVVTQEIIVSQLEAEHYRVKLKMYQILSSSARKIITLSPESLLVEVVLVMHEQNIGSVLLAEKESIVGIITERDILGIVSRHVPMSTPAEKVMNRPVIAVDGNDSVQSIVRMMEEKQIRRVLVQNEQSRPVGIVSMRDIIRNIKGNYGFFVENKLKHTKQAMNIIDEAIIELYRQDDEHIIQWKNQAALDIFGHAIVDKPITSLIDEDTWPCYYGKIQRDGRT